MTVSIITAKLDRDADGAEISNQMSALAGIWTPNLSIRLHANRAPVYAYLEDALPQLE